ncbi:MAG: hypothetical protein ACKO2P_07215 [Planctomycetota bacterium]
MAKKKAAGTRLKRTTVLTLPRQTGKALAVWFPAEVGARVGNKNADLKIEEFLDNGDVKRTWTPVGATAQERKLNEAQSKFGVGAKIYWNEVQVNQEFAFLKSRKRKGTPLNGDLILVTVTITVPPIPNVQEEQIVDVFELEAVVIDLP